MKWSRRKYYRYGSLRRASWLDKPMTGVVMRRNLVLILVMAVLGAAFVFGPDHQAGQRLLGIAAPSKSDRPQVNGVGMGDQKPSRRELKTDARESPGSRLRGRLLQNSDWKTALAEFQADASIPESERLFYEAVILDACSFLEEATANQRRDVAEATKRGLSDVIAAVTSAMTDPRQKAAMTFNLERRIPFICRGFADRKISRQEVDGAYRAAASAGHPGAQARVIEQRIADSSIKNVSTAPPELINSMPPGQAVGFPDRLTKSEMAQLMAGLFSEDPVAIKKAGSVLSLAYENQSLRIGNDQLDLGRHSDEVWSLVACDFGFECGEHNAIVSFACAETKRCADDYSSYLRQFELTPDEFDFVQRAAQQIGEAIRRRDYGAFQLVGKPGSSYNFIRVPTLIRIR
jgi:hypothetical protein